ncbi:MAG TPA: APC family permease, partial [Tepidisphaeraceae bacterium]|nr:APC family permease [Tepidisphaeraceae bacterium]
LNLVLAERPRNVGWIQSAGLLFGDWGTSRLYVLGLAFFFAGRTSFWLILTMSLLVVAVGWAYTHICRIYPDGGGVYSAARRRSKALGVFAALLLFADYTITASLSALEAFHYFGLPLNHAAQIDKPVVVDAGSDIILHPKKSESTGDVLIDDHKLLKWDSPGLWAIVALMAIGAFNLFGPSHTGKFAVVAALSVVTFTALLAITALFKIDYSQLPARIGQDRHHPFLTWQAFASIVLALSGVEAIANLTGVMKRPVTKTSSRAIWIVTIEVALFNMILAVAMLAIFPIGRDEHKEDMIAFLSGHYLGHWAEIFIRILGGLLLLSASNTAINALIGVQYMLARDGELPTIFQKLNAFGVPLLPALIAVSVPVCVLIVVHDLEHLAALYAIGVVGAITIDVTLCAMHPRLRKWWRRAPMYLLGVVLIAILLTVAITKTAAVLFVTGVVIAGFIGRHLSKRMKDKDAPSLLRQAMAEQLQEVPASMPRFLIGTYGSTDLAESALRQAQISNAALVVCFVREVAVTSALSQIERRWTIDTDLAAVRTFTHFLRLANAHHVPIIMAYETGQDATTVLAETAVMFGCDRILLGSSRHGPMHRAIKGRFQARLEGVLPPEVKVEVIHPDMRLGAAPV